MRWIALTSGVLAAVITTVACRGDEPFVDPYSVSSPSGSWVFKVDPSTPQGEGGCRAVMLKAGKEMWSKQMELTPRECVVSEEGVVVGYAYNNGYMGWDGVMVGLVIGFDGAVLTRDEHARDGPAIAITPPPPGNPRGQQVILDQDGGRAVIIVSTKETMGGAPVEWWIYDLKDGRLRKTQTPEPPGKGNLTFSRLIRAEMVSGTGLMAAHWYVYKHGAGEAVFELIDREGAIVWSRRIESEYSSMPEHWRWWDLVEQDVRQIEVGTRGKRGDDDEAGSFSVISYAGKHRTRYVAAKQAGGDWRVEEEGSEAGEPRAVRPAQPKLEFTPGTLTPRGEIRIGAAEGKTALCGFSSLSFDDRGRVGWVRWASEGERAGVGSQRFTLADREGRVVADWALDLPSSKRATRGLSTWIQGDRWLVARTDYSDKGESASAAWWLDASTGKIEAIEAFRAGDLKRLVPTGDGGFMVLGSLLGQFTIREQVLRFDREGKLVASQTQPGFGRGESIQDIAVLSDGTVARLSIIPDRLVLERAGGPQVWSVSTVVAGVPKREQSYYANVRPDREGGLVLYDSANENLLMRIDRDGKCWEWFHACGPAGERFRIYDAFAVDPDGRVWGSDGHRLFRFGRDGRADLCFGGPGDGHMGDPVAVTLDRQGRIYALEQGTAAVHVFDEMGKPVRVMRPLPSDTPTQDALAWIRVGDDGSVEYRVTWEGPIVRFGADGQRLGVSTPPDSWTEQARQAWTVIRGGGWEQSVAGVRRITGAGNVGPEIARRSDGGWIVDIVDAETGPDGSLAVLCERRAPGSWGGAQGPLWLCVYGPDGSGRSTLPVPRDSTFMGVLWVGTRVALTDQTGITLLNDPANLVGRRFDYGNIEGDFWHTLGSADGTVRAWRAGSRSVMQWEVRP